MRVLQLFTSLDRGGMERQTLQLTAALAASGAWDVHVASLRCHGPLAAELSALGFDDIPCFPLTSLYGPGAARQVLRLAGLLRRRRIQVLHAHDFYTNVLGIAAAVLARTPVRIASRRELDVFTPRQRRVERVAYRNATAVLANCDALRRQLVLEGLPDRRIFLLPNAVDPARVAVADPAEPARLRRTLGIPADVAVVTMLANLYNHRKDIPTFVRAAAAVAAVRPRAAFVLAGGGDVGAVHALAECCTPRPHLVLPGSLDRIGALLHATDVCVQASHSEGASNAVLEAMAAGRPVVATAVGGTPELVHPGVTGWLTPPGDAPAMASRILDLLERPAAARAMGERGRERARTSHTPEEQARRVQKIYHELVADRIPRRPAC